MYLPPGQPTHHHAGTTGRCLHCERGLVVTSGRRWVHDDSRFGPCCILIPQSTTAHPRPATIRDSVREPVDV
jgi:hypothetical protein